MKKFFVFLVLSLILSAGNLAFGQMTNSEIMEMISRSKEVNAQVGITNPSLIYPGQVLTFLFEDGSWQEILVEKGDNQWTIVQNKLVELEEDHGSVVDPNEVVVEPKQPVNPEPIPQVEPNNAVLPWWGWIIFIIFVLLLLYGVFKSKYHPVDNNSKPKYSSNPEREGRPFVDGGVNNENAENHFRELAEMNNPGVNVQIKDVESFYVSTPGGLPAVVEFADDTKNEFTFINRPGHAGFVSVDGGQTFNREVYFDACGNPVYMRKSMKDQPNLILSKEPIDFNDWMKGIVVGLPTEEKVEEVLRVEKKDVSSKKMEELFGDDLTNVSGDHALVAEKFLQTQTAHKVTMEFVRNADGSTSLKSMFETKNDPVKVKTEEKNN